MSCMVVDAEVEVAGAVVVAASTVCLGGADQHPSHQRSSVGRDLNEKIATAASLTATASQIIMGKLTMAA
jgi:hypothetical protein